MAYIHCNECLCPWLDTFIWIALSWKELQSCLTSLIIFIFRRIFFNKNIWISIKISLKVDNIPSLVQKMVWRCPGVKPLSEAVMINLPTHIFITRPQCSDVKMSMMASQITSLTIVYSTVNADTDQRKHQSSASLTCVWGIHRSPVNSPHKSQ